MKETFTLLGGNVTLLRQVDMPSEDGIWLAACVGARLAGAQVLDAFCGTGVVGLCALHYGADRVTAVDNNADLVGQSMANAALNGASEKWVPVCSDMADVKVLRGKTYDVVLANPPFYALHAGYASEDKVRAAARGVAAGDLAVWLAALYKLRAAGGVLAVVLHVREVDKVQALAAQVGEDVRWIFLQSAADKPAKRVVAILGVGGGTCVLPVHKAEVQAVGLRGGAVSEKMFQFL